MQYKVYYLCMVLYGWCDFVDEWMWNWDEGVGGDISTINSLCTMYRLRSKKVFLSTLKDKSYI